MSDGQFTTSVIIATRNRKAELMCCLDSLLSQSVKTFELIVVDSSDDPSENTLREKIKNSDKRIQFTYICSTKVGLTFQRNLGIKKSHGDILIFLDDDTVLEKDYLQKHMETYENDSLGEIMGCSGVILGDKPYSSLGQLFRKIFLMTRPDVGSRILLSGFSTICAFDFLLSTIKEVEVCCGCNVSYRKEVFQRFLFDEQFKGYGFMEDKDFSCRVSRKFKLVVNPEIRLYHRASSLGRDDLRKRIIMCVFYHWRFVWKNMPHLPHIWISFLWSEIGTFLYDLITEGIKPCVYRMEGLCHLLTRQELKV
ncbi:glycosyltransferase family 2 protein [bacterium]|nr:glycosyltransferase family 2 protein [bacterium]